MLSAAAPKANQNLYGERPTSRSTQMRAKQLDNQNEDGRDHKKSFIMIRSSLVSSNNYSAVKSANVALSVC